MLKRGTQALIVILFLLLTGRISSASEPIAHSSERGRQQSTLTWERGAIIRGDLSKKQIALVFTGGEYGEGTATILEALQRSQIKAGFFVTGAYLRQTGHAELIRRALREGHYVGPHSDQHPLYCSWEDRDKTLITREQFEVDLLKNIKDLKRLGALADGPVYFIPPYEWFNGEQTEWAEKMQIQMFNFSPGSGSNRDYIPESDPHFISSQKIMEGILGYEKAAPHGLNGYVLLLHLGADRSDKMFLRIEPLIAALKGRGYEFIRIDQMLHE